MGSKRRYIIVSILILISLMSIFLYTSKKPAINQPTSQNGYLDLSSWDFSKNGNVKLEGNWEFYWNKLMDPADFHDENSKDPDGYMYVPSVCKGSVGGEKITEHGAATYRLKVRLNNANQVLGVRTTSIRLSYKIFVDGVEVLSSGKPALSRVAYVATNVPHTTFFYPTNKEVEIIVQVADYDFREGGIVQNIYLGKQEDINKLAIEFVTDMSTSTLIR